MSKLHSNLAAARLTPGIDAADANVAYWIARINIMLRREVSWCWRIRDEHIQDSSALPPMVDATAENLDLVRYEDEKNRFFETNAAARYLTGLLAELEPPGPEAAGCSRWAWVVRHLDLDETAQFLLGLVLAGRLDAGLGPVFATCLNDRAKPFPTLSLAQRLWMEPAKLVDCADTAHPLFRTGILFVPETVGDIRWSSEIDMHSAVARHLVWPDSPLPSGLRLLEEASSRAFDPAGKLLLDRLRSTEPLRMEVIPLIGYEGTAFENCAASIAQSLGRSIAVIDPTTGPSSIAPLALIAWLHGVDVLVPESWADAGGERSLANMFSSVKGIPLRWYVPARSVESIHSIPGASITPPLQIAPLSFEERVERFSARLSGLPGKFDTAIEECARRFRYQENTIDRAASTFIAAGESAGADSLMTACRNESPLNLSGLAQPVTPRFRPDELVLPAKQRRQFADIIRAMRSLTEVHYRWGTAREWNEAGLAVLFAGPPGTGKTMAAESLATALDLPMYRVDLSQVVNKYIGETEKNLKRVFDASEMSDCILFFDEADALFGKRTDVKDSHDRFANIEISYLLERMERFKGLAILATNRKKDLDEAFMRRLRFVIDFPLPDVNERERIWRQVFPPGVDISNLDFEYLARQFALTGGHIRSVAFAACLGSASRGVSPKVEMPVVLLAVKRELEKMNRAAGEGVFGNHDAAVRRLEQ